MFGYYFLVVVFVLHLCRNNAQLLTSTTPATTSSSPINITIISMRPDEMPFNQLINSLPTTAQQQITAIRNNIFLNLKQQSDQISDVMDSLGPHAVDAYNGIKTALEARFANISNVLSLVPPGPAKTFIEQREAVFNTTDYSMFDFQNRIQGVVTSFNELNQSTQLEVYNFILGHTINGNFTIDESLAHIPAVVMTDAIRTKLMNVGLYDSNSTPMQTFISLLPSAQQEAVKSILTNTNYRKSTMQNKLQTLVASWGPAYEAAYNNTMEQQYELLELMIFLEPGLAEPFKSFIKQKINLMNDMAITSSFESQQFQSLASRFQNVLTPLMSFVNSATSI